MFCQWEGIAKYKVRSKLTRYHSTGKVDVMVPFVGVNLPGLDEAGRCQ